MYYFLVGSDWFLIKSVSILSILYLGVIVLSVSAVDVPVSAQDISVVGEYGASLFRGVRWLLQTKLVGPKLWQA